MGYCVKVGGIFYFVTRQRAVDPLGTIYLEGGVLRLFLDKTLHPLEHQAMSLSLPPSARPSAWCYLALGPGLLASRSRSYRSPQTFRRRLHSQNEETGPPSARPPAAASLLLRNGIRSLPARARRKKNIPHSSLYFPSENQHRASGRASEKLSSCWRFQISSWTDHPARLKWKPFNSI